VAINPKSGAAYFEMGKAYRSREEWGLAAQALEQAIELDPQASQYYYVLSYVYKKLGKIEKSHEAMEHFRKLGGSASNTTR
jgi:uncharacterized protein HemY